LLSLTLQKSAPTTYGVPVRATLLLLPLMLSCRSSGVPANPAKHDVPSATREEVGQVDLLAMRDSAKAVLDRQIEVSRKHDSAGAVADYLPGQTPTNFKNGKLTWASWNDMAKEYGHDVRMYNLTDASYEIKRLDVPAPGVVVVSTTWDWAGTDSIKAAWHNRGASTTLMKVLDGRTRILQDHTSFLPSAKQ
jgi:hypothetical protein